MAKRSASSKPFFSGDTQHDAFAEFLLHSSEVENILPLVDERFTSPDVSDKPDGIVATETVYKLSDNLAIETIRDKKKSRSETGSPSMTELSLYISNMLEVPAISSGKLTRAYVTKESIQPLKIVVSYLDSKGVKVTLARLFDSIIRDHVQQYKELFILMGKSKR